jgi:uncharacterized spore protein YtfJ
MSNNAQDILDTILGRLKTLASTETVVGSPVTVGDVTLLPVVKVSVGFAAGAGSGGSGDKSNNGQGSGSGGGGGASITPVGFISYDGSEIKFIPVGKGKLDALFEAVPELIKKFGLGGSKKGTDKKEGSTEED